MAFSQQQILEASRSAPQAVRSYLMGSRPGELVREFGQKYGLHIDTMDRLSSAVTYLLLGLLNPGQFQTTLAQIGITGNVADSIVAELNERAFKPLQEAVRNPPPAESEKEEEDVEVPPPSLTTPSNPEPTFAAAARMSPDAPLMPPPAVTARPKPIPMPPPPPLSASLPVESQRQVPAPRPAPPTPQAPPASATRPAQPAAPQFMQAMPESGVGEVRPVPPPPANLPGANPVQAQEVRQNLAWPQPIVPSVPPPYSPEPSQATEDAAKYRGIDPYREAIE